MQKCADGEYNFTYKIFYCYTGFFGWPFLLLNYGTFFLIFDTMAGQSQAAKTKAEHFPSVFYSRTELDLLSFNLT